MSKGIAFAVIVGCAVIVFFERSLPWLVFAKKEMPPIIKKLSNVLPAALMIILVVYSLRELANANLHDGLALIIASVFTAVFHYFKKNQILSILLGTLVYMMLMALLK